jgi:hypothetical protein
VVEADMSDAQGWNSAWGQVVVQAWTDDTFKQRLLADPATVLREQGLTPPADKQLRIVEDTAETVHVVLPARPAELSDEDLDRVAGGGGDGALLSFSSTDPPHPYHHIHPPTN